MPADWRQYIKQSSQFANIEHYLMATKKLCAEQKANYDNDIFRAATSEARRAFSQKHTFQMDTTTVRPHESLPKSVIDLLVKQRNCKKWREDKRDDKREEKRDRKKSEETSNRHWSSSRTSRWEKAQKTRKDEKTKRPRKEEKPKRVTFEWQRAESESSAATPSPVSKKTFLPSREKLKAEAAGGSRPMKCYNCGKEGHNGTVKHC